MRAVIAVKLLNLELALLRGFAIARLQSKHESDACTMRPPRRVLPDGAHGCFRLWAAA